MNRNATPENKPGRSRDLREIFSKSMVFGGVPLRHDHRHRANASRAYKLISNRSVGTVTSHPSKRRPRDKVPRPPRADGPPSKIGRPTFLQVGVSDQWVAWMVTLHAQYDHPCHPFAVYSHLEKSWSDDFWTPGVTMRVPGRASGRAPSCVHFLVLREFSIPVERNPQNRRFPTVDVETPHFPGSWTKMEPTRDLGPQ